MPRRRRRDFRGFRDFFPHGVAFRTFRLPAEYVFAFPAKFVVRARPRFVRGRVPRTRWSDDIAAVEWVLLYTGINTCVGRFYFFTLISRFTRPWAEETVVRSPTRWDLKPRADVEIAFGIRRDGETP